ncbi:hypothetical protein GRI38_00975 [Altererythrobacter aurantiacus]|uniref:Uncharacterized protein n=1 Tax=Parapontixanthobacter aurantiacus TaxID=1463599 RepID=A0A844Z9K8_9SPHN|nr:hypothetical protein [Parapontixanthobacter aurantiacus]MXO84605.1 hypothetical protein [Parapontixanthobacter aurantiacus]
MASPVERPAPSLGLMPFAQTPGPWSGDTWLLLRGGQRTVQRAGAPAGVLGEDQIGAVLRYRIAQAGGRNIALHARASKALSENGEAELAIGLQARLLASIPVVAHVEGRLALRDDETELRPAAFVTTGFDDVALPLGAKARGYGQAGYVGGAFATPFADGHIVASREVASFDLAPSVAGKVEVGAGAWGGAQEGAARIDVGPEASVTLQIADVPLRIAASYRVRVGGDAMPADGAAITISTGF